MMARVEVYLHHANEDSFKNSTIYVNIVNV